LHEQNSPWLPCIGLATIDTSRTLAFASLPRGVTVARTWDDHYMKYICGAAGIIIPPLPEKNVVQKYQMTSEFIEQRRQALQVYVNRVVSPDSPGGVELSAICKWFCEESLYHDGEWYINLWIPSPYMPATLYCYPLSGSPTQLDGARPTSAPPHLPHFGVPVSPQEIQPFLSLSTPPSLPPCVVSCLAAHPSQERESSPDLHFLNQLSHPRYASPILQMPQSSDCNLL